MNSLDSVAKGTSFWRKSGKPLPGRPSSLPPPPGSQHGSGGNNINASSSSISSSTLSISHSPLKSSTARFQDYESSVSDAWDISPQEDGGPDELLGSSLSPNSQDVSSFSSSQHLNSKLPSSRPGTRTRVSSHQTSSSSNSSSASSVGSLGHTVPSLASLKDPQLSTSATRLMGNDNSKATTEVTSSIHSKRVKIEKLLESSSVNLDELRKLSWSGISPSIRNKIWRILCGYHPPSNRGEDVVSRKREEYQRLLAQYFLKREEETDAGHVDTYRQIHIDIPRMSPVVGLFQQRSVQEIFERILYIWAIRHPASGYVQGINDLVTPFFLVFLQEYLPLGKDYLCPDIDLENDLSKEQRDIIEADSFWCLTKVLDGIQDHYTFAQPGIQLKVKQLEELIKRIDIDLHNHLVSHDVLYLQFAFRWMNNLLMREIPIKAVIRLWDTYLSEKNGFSHFHLYVTAAFLMRFKDEILRRTDFHTVLMFLQNLPTAKWGDTEIDLIVAEAFQLSYLFADAPSHLNNFVKTNDASTNK